MPPILPAAFRNDFEAVSLLGSGGRGRVFKVRRKSDGRLLALKTLPDATAESARQFQEEAALLAALSHPNLVRIEDYFEGPPLAYLMEAIDGEPLNRFLEKAEPEAVLASFAACARALHFLHARGLLHRDLKPANILVAGGTPKLIDFGLPGFGTPAYWAPEAKAGHYDARSDLYALGLSFLESVEGRIDLPDFFRELLLRLVAEDPSQRPASAVSLIKFLNRHLEDAFPLGPEDADAALAKTPWVARPEENAFRTQEREARVVVVTGPTGVGRSRFTEEMAWQRKLAGSACVVVGDLHRLTEEQRKAAEVALRSALRDPKALVLIEYASDLPLPPGARAWIDALRSRSDVRTLELKDLPKALAVEFLKKATEEDPLPAKDYETMAKEAGGRPLLLVEALRQRLATGRVVKFPSSLQDACEARMEALPEPARRLFTLLLTAYRTPARSDLTAAFGAGNVGEAEAVLRRAGLVAETAALAPAHPSLSPTYLAALAKDEIAASHDAWKMTLVARHGGPEAHSDAPDIARHALDAGDAETARLWSRGAVERLFAEGRYAETVDTAHALLPVAAERMDRVILHGHLGPALYRLGRFDEALKAYDAWFGTKGDDDTKVETIKYNLFTGQVLMAAARTEEARERLGTVLKTGDPEKHANLKAYHARAHALLAAMDEHADDADGASIHLDAAQPLAASNPLLTIEIANQRGLLLQARGRYDDARASFETAIRTSIDTSNRQSEAIGWNNLGILERERGAFLEALEALDKAVALAREGGEIVQLARYRQNRALVLKELALFDRAFPEMAEAHDTLAVYGNDDEKRRSAQLARGLEELTLDATGRDLSTEELSLRGGPRFAALARLAALRRGDGAEHPESELVAAIEAIAALASPLLRAELFAELSETLKALKLTGLSERVSWKARDELNQIQKRLPEELQWMRTKPAA